MSSESPSRRRLLLAVAVGTAALAGCGRGDVATRPATDGNTTTPGGASDTGTADALDLREANVVGVRAERDGDSIRFDVTLHHDDDGEDGYANWWQVETLAGDRLGRRDLLHPHSQQPFTRSETVAVPAETSCVVVRGHDQTHGYGGQAMVVNVDTGATTAVAQGAARQSLADCP